MSIIFFMKKKQTSLMMRYNRIRSLITDLFSIHRSFLFPFSLNQFAQLLQRTIIIYLIISIQFDHHYQLDKRHLLLRLSSCQHQHKHQTFNFPRKFSSSSSKHFLIIIFSSSNVPIQHSPLNNTNPSHLVNAPVNSQSPSMPNNNYSSPPTTNRSVLLSGSTIQSLLIFIQQKDMFFFI